MRYPGVLPASVHPFWQPNFPATFWTVTRVWVAAFPRAALEASVGLVLTRPWLRHFVWPAAKLGLIWQRRYFVAGLVEQDEIPQHPTEVLGRMQPRRSLVPFATGEPRSKVPDLYLCSLADRWPIERDGGSSAFGLFGSQSVVAIAFARIVPPCAGQTLSFDGVFPVDQLALLGHWIGDLTPGPARWRPLADPRPVH